VKTSNGKRTVAKNVAYILPGIRHREEKLNPSVEGEKKQRGKKLQMRAFVRKENLRDAWGRNKETL